jgi:hypothetical protein
MIGHMIGKWERFKPILAEVLCENYLDLFSLGYRPDDEQIKSEIADLFGGYFLKFIGRHRGLPRGLRRTRRSDGALERYLRDLEERIDPAAEAALERNWLCLRTALAGVVLSLEPRGKNPSRIEWPDVMMNDALDDPDVMIYSELCRMNRQLAQRAGAARVSQQLRFEYFAGTAGRGSGGMPYAQNSLPGCRR